MKRETQQESSKDNDGEDEHGISEKSYSPPLSPVRFPQNHNKSLSTSPSSSPLHDYSPSHEDIYHTNEFRLTPPADQTIHHSKFAPPAALTKAEEWVAEPGESREEVENRRSSRPYLLQRARRQSLVRRAMLGLRISGILICLISFSVMAADKKQGWASDSFSNYKEFRYCLAVNVLGFVYSGIQTYYFTTGKHVLQHYLRYYFDFLMDQILTYLVISASSSAATRVEDWESNWGKDKFPEMARASMALSFLASLDLPVALSSPVTPYVL